MHDVNTKDLTQEQAKNYIFVYYSGCDISFLNVLIKYWSGKHPTQVMFRKYLNELISKKKERDQYLLELDKTK